MMICVIIIMCVIIMICDMFVICVIIRDHHLSRQAQWQTSLQRYPRPLPSRRARPPQGFLHRDWTWPLDHLACRHHREHSALHRHRPRPPSPHPHHCHRLHQHTFHSDCSPSELHDRWRHEFLESCHGLFPPSVLLELRQQEEHEHVPQGKYCAVTCYPRCPLQNLDDTKCGWNESRRHASYKIRRDACYETKDRGGRGWNKTHEAEPHDRGPYKVRPPRHSFVSYPSCPPPPPH
mmetsp:Transcript_104155/g.167846  ORF Transcript_104155/g.167846 Transcript_104155/m.167846 type:complete len:235 (+) Transcript_104155:193-897(+)